MTAVGTATARQILAGASSHKELDWNQIDWRTVKANVRRLQARSAIRSLETAFQDGGGAAAR